MKYTAVSAPPTSAAAAATRTKPSLRGVSHQLAALASVATGSYLVCLAASRGRPALVGSVVYSLSVLALFTMSAVYHRVTWNPSERAILRRMDHAAIFVLIAGTYTPIVLPTFGDEGYARKFLLVIWLLATLGIGISVFWPSAPKALVALICIGFSSAGLLKWREVSRVPSLVARASHSDPFRSFLHNSSLRAA